MVVCSSRRMFHSSYGESIRSDLLDETLKTRYVYFPRVWIRDMIVVAAEVLPIQSKKEYEPEEKDGQDSTVLSPLQS